MELIFRKPTLSDRSQIDKFLDTLKNDYVPQFSDKEKEEELNKIYTGKSKSILALTLKNQLVGYIVWENYSKNKEYGYIANIGVHPKYRRKGISTKLMKMVFDQIKKTGFKGVYYTTWHKNTGMAGLSKELKMKIVKVYLDEKFRGSGGKTIIFRKVF